MIAENLRKKFNMDQSMFSGYFRGSSFGEGSGGLIGYLNLSDDMQRRLEIPVRLRIVMWQEEITRIIRVTEQTNYGEA